LSDPIFKTKSIKYNRGYAHVSRFLGLRCAPDLLTARLFPNGKEVSESMAALNGVRTHICPGRVDINNPNVVVVSVGDGKTPRTAALFAFMTKWQCISVDPMMREIEGNTNFNGIEICNLAVIGRKIEDISLDLSDYEHVIIVGVHSHASVRAMFDGIVFNKADFIFIPCCVNQVGIGKIVIEYEDEAIWSPENKVIISLDIE